jgi:hypothetical protein
MSEFVTESILKTDEFSQTQVGFLASDPNRVLVRRVVSGVAWWARPIARILARFEVTALRACVGIEGVPQVISVDPDGLVRTWSEGMPLHVARPRTREFYRDAARLLRDLRRAGVTHNDLAKPQNWLMTPEGLASVIDFQLAKVHRRRGRLFRLMAYEDLRHLLKQKRAFAPELLTPTEARIASRRSLPSRVWRATGKQLYIGVTRGLMGWSDGEGFGGRLERDGPATRSALLAVPGVTAVALVPFQRENAGAGLYAFCEGSLQTDRQNLMDQHKAAGGLADRIQVVEALPRTPMGAIRDDILMLIVRNDLRGLHRLLEAESPELGVLAQKIAGSRLDI